MQGGESLADRILDGFFNVIGIAFTERWVAPLVILPVMIASAVVLILSAWRQFAPFLRAAKTRIFVLSRALGRDPDPVGERMAFADHFDEVKASLGSSDQGAEPLLRAWHEFHESIVDETESPIRNTARPSGFFGRAVPSLHFLTFWSNVFVGVGLILTFLGIVIALNTAGKSMGGEVAATQGALQGLLTVAGAKFFASIGGLLASLLLRFADASFQKRIRRSVDQICGLLERGLLYVPPQRIAAQQLAELERQSVQFERFNTELALTIGEQIGARFQSAVAPIANSLGVLNDNMAGMSERMGDSLGRGAADAVSAAASGELRALGQTLEALRGQLDEMGNRVGGSSEDAARQIRAAGADFAEAATNIRQAFEQLTTQVDGMGRSLAAEGEAGAQRQTAAISQALAGFESAQENAARAMTEVVHRLGEAGRETAESLHADMGEAIRLATTESQLILKAAANETGTALASAGKELVQAVRDSADRLGQLALAIERSERGAAGAADAFQLSADRASTLAGTMRQAAEGFTTAAAPVGQASRAMEAAADKVSRAVAEQSQAGASALVELKELSAGIKETQIAAANAWRDYRARFEGVDESLGNTLEEMSRALGDAMKQFKDFAHQFDLELSKAVSRIASGLAPLEENSEAIAEFADVLRQRPAAE